MKVTDRSATDTTTITLPTKLGCVLTFAAVASTSGITERGSTSQVGLYDFRIPTSVLSVPESGWGAIEPAHTSTGKAGLTVAEMADSIEHFLRQQGMKAGRAVLTGDGSRLLQFSGRTQ